MAATSSTSSNSASPLGSPFVPKEKEKTSSSISLKGMIRAVKSPLGRKKAALPKGLAPSSEKAASVDTQKALQNVLRPKIQIGLHRQQSGALVPSQAVTTKPAKTEQFSLFDPRNTSKKATYLRGLAAGIGLKNFGKLGITGPAFRPIPKEQMQIWKKAFFKDLPGDFYKEMGISEEDTKEMEALQKEFETYYSRTK